MIYKNQEFLYFVILINKKKIKKRNYKTKVQLLVLQSIINMQTRSGSGRISNFFKVTNNRSKFQVRGRRKRSVHKCTAVAEPIQKQQFKDTVTLPATPRQQYEPSEGWQPYAGYLSKEQIWQSIRDEALQAAQNEPALASLLHSTVLAHYNIERTLAFILANKLASETLLGTHLMRLIVDAYDDDPEIIECMLADVQSVYERDPACDKYITPLLFFKGFQAVQSHRISHYLWNQGRKSLAFALQSRMSDVFHVDIHPAAQIGKGILIDHATGVVIGETAVVGDNVSLLHHVTLGGSGRERNGGRHPTIGHGVLLGAGVCVLGPVLVGNGSKVGAGSVVVSSIPCHSVAVGVPAKVIKRLPKCEAPCLNMDQTLDFILDFQI
eukprot:TRINITY_DN8968_c0_g1_i3.p1 TRINITY_DN8968_c0_g1~~TRINITY_DN8968_c0_g1_i3.p1  ORF type:complete len:393 (+),score=43.31 TRINITY_DN8968_c0_g1_i3:37-1179(+)